MKVKLNDVSETMLIPLYSRYCETKKINGMINDPKSIEMVSNIDYDFSKFENSKMTQLGVSCRTLILDEQTKRFIKENPEGICVSMGCGLDTRFERVNNGKISWYDLDLPEVIAIRKKFYKNNSQQRMISKSIFDESWVNEIDCKGESVLFIFEGILMYFSKEEIKKILITIEKYFKGSLILMELSSKLMVKFGSKHETVKKTNAKFKWGVNSAEEVEKLANNIKFLDQWYLFDKYKEGSTFK